MASIVPDDPTATSNPSRRTRRVIGARTLRTCRAQASTAPGCSTSERKNRSVRRMAPSLSDPTASTWRRSPTNTSVEPPPMSISTRRLSNTGTACSTPRWMRRASSAPVMTSTSTPASSRARARNSPAFAASRTALVATATSAAPCTSATARHRASAATPRSIASGDSSDMSVAPEPSRTISFSRAITSNRSPSTTRATTRWNELVPRSTAAMVSGSLTPAGPAVAGCGARSRRRRRGRPRAHRR